ncbi:hypothetical protein HPB52_011369 [Rhipicephalus sanguineus]|uniref:Uncharacterized protein n=1 Tax=Rhipicephalus sanguineus TaxID=34632 RepID=A0A9D4T9H4_RHISA|nr:hypothetical protein HPB52_011369 [Rhipicephalus sanguineus]
MTDLIEQGRKSLPKNYRTVPGSHEAFPPESNTARLCRAAATRTTPTTISASPPPPSLPSKQTSASPSRPRRRAKIPRLPADTIHLLAPNLQDLPLASCDTLRIHPVNNTFTLSVADSARAQAYLRITSLTVSGTTFTAHLYALPPDDVPWWILYHGVHLRLLPFHNKVDAYFNYRSTGHRTDVCPKPRQDQCYRCDATHPPPP